MIYMPVPEAPTRRWRTLQAATLLFVSCIGVWLASDVWRVRARTLAQARHLVEQKSQFLGRAFGDTFLATDYVLRDVLWHAQGGADPGSTPAGPVARHPGGTPSLDALEALLRAKRESIPALTDLVVFDRNCVFQALAVGNFRGRHSTQAFCKDRRVGPGERLHIQYLPADRSASRRPVITLARTRGDAQGLLVGGVLAVLDLGNTQAWLSGFAVDGHDSLALMDTDARLLARVPYDVAVQGHALTPSPEQPALDGLRGGASFISISPVDGRRRVYGIARLEQFPIVALVGLDADEVLRSWSHRAIVMGLGYLGLLMLVGLLLRNQASMMFQRGELQRLAATDALTGLANRRQLLAGAQREFARARRKGTPLAMLMLDLDRFKSINDRWGHPTGDRVLQHMAQLLGQQARGQDVAGRLGGEEFALLLPDTDGPGAVVIAERLRGAVQVSDAVRTGDGEVVRYTVSVGVATLEAGDASFESLLQRVDRALYQAKERGRNRVETATAGD